MIEHADAALAAWFATLTPPVGVAFERAEEGGGESADARTGKRPGPRPTLLLELTRVREQHDRRDNQIDEVREGGVVVGRRRATRFFELDYRCTVSGPIGDAHRALGDLLQLLVDHDVVPSSYVPAELHELGHPIDVQLVASPVPAAGVTVRLVLPVRPTLSTDVGPPTRSLHLDMAPPPGRTPGATTGATTGAASGDLPPIGERRWTTVRRRELIGSSPSVSERHDTTGAGGSGA